MQKKKKKKKSVECTFFKKAIRLPFVEVIKREKQIDVNKDDFEISFLDIQEIPLQISGKADLFE